MIVPELKRALFFLTVVAKTVYHLLSLRSRVNLQWKSPRCCFVKTVCSLDTDAAKQFTTVCSRSLPKIDVILLERDFFSAFKGELYASFELCKRQVHETDCRERTTAGCERHNNSELERLVGAM